MIELLPGSFNKALEARGFTPRTQKVYRYHAGCLLDFFNAPADELETGDLQDWIVYTRTELCWKPSTVNSAMSAVRILYEAIGRQSVTKGIRNLRHDTPEPTVLSAEEVSAIFAAADTNTLRCAIALLYGAGLRISELLALRFEDIDSGRSVLRIQRPKNRHARDAILPATALALLRQQWLERRAHAPITLGDLVFVSRKGTALSRAVIASALAKSAVIANVRKRVYPHLLRHSFATTLIESGVDMSFVQKLLGHHSLTSTGRYIHLTSAARLGITSPVDSASFPVAARRR